MAMEDRADSHAAQAQAQGGGEGYWPVLWSPGVVQRDAAASTHEDVAKVLKTIMDSVCRYPSAEKPPC